MEAPVRVLLWAVAAAFWYLSKGKQSTISRFIYYMFFINVCGGVLSKKTPQAVFKAAIRCQHEINHSCYQCQACLKQVFSILGFVTSVFALKPFLKVSYSP